MYSLGPLCSTAITPFHRYYEPLRLPAYRTWGQGLPGS